MASDLSDRSAATLATDSSVSDLTKLHRFGLLALERTRIPMIITDPRKRDNPIVLANEPFLRMTGYTADAVVGRNCRFMQGPDTDPETVSRLRSAVAEGRETTVEILNYHRDGRPFWNQLLVSPVFDDDRTLSYFFASQLDVTRQRTAEDLEVAEHLLLKEVDHRAKNALALVKAIMRLSRSDDPATYARVVQGRVDALARAHALLAECRWRGVSLRRLIQSEARLFGRQRIVIDGPQIRVASAQVQPLALLLHEMFQNAARFGSLSVPGGSVAIEWSKKTDGALTICWRESGGPLLLETPKPALGMDMVRTMIERQLRGRSAFVWSPAGLDATFSFRSAIPEEVGSANC